ncbi:MAG: RagB/SusD family nutrient uptake outer membrane protein [Paludibacteraceae bacterium]|nr:RagB/SusD family nutrient uptake outer membrane protein [Paludibacteraceae bacterium]MBO7258919.1 RagB/SusD family nutrient uptake outer membrane protein [Paludibacteraceae bacterium]
MKKTIYILTLLLVGCLFTGCEDFLTAENKTAGGQNAGDYFTKDPATLRVYAYSLLKPVVARVDVYEEGVDLYMASNKKTGSEFDRYTLTPESDNVKSLYADLYACINMANATMFYDQAGAYKGEMLFLRAYCYYVLSQQFGEVPYIKEYINNSERNYPRTPLNDVYTYIIDDLTTALTDPNLKATATDGNASKRAVNALLAKVYLAAAWDLGTTLTDANNGTYQIKDKTYFTQALNYAKEAIGSQALAMTFDDKWSPKNEGNEEVIFAVQYARNGWPGELKTGGHGLQNTFGSYYGDCTSTGEKYVDGLHASNPKSSYLWTADDARYDATFMTTMYNAPQAGWGTVGYYAYYNADAAVLDTMPVALRIFPGTASTSLASTYQTEHAAQLQQGACINAPAVLVMSYPDMWVNGSKKEYVAYVNQDPGMFAAPVVKKFDDPASAAIAVNKTNGYRDIVVLHLSDIYLVAAEAALLADDAATALTYINDVRARAGVAATDWASYKPAYADLDCYAAFTATDIDLILDERARELYAEGHRWMDLRRTRQLVRYNNIFNADLAGQALSMMSNASGEVKWYRPIPQSEVNGNDAYKNGTSKQNPGY